MEGLLSTGPTPFSYQRSWEILMHNAVEEVERREEYDDPAVSNLLLNT